MDVIKWAFLIVAFIGVLDALYRGWGKWNLIPMLKGENAIRSTTGYSGELIISGLKDIFWILLIVFGERWADAVWGIALAVFGIGCYLWAVVNRHRWRLIIRVDETVDTGGRVE